MKILATLLSISATLWLVACSPSLSPNTYTADSVGVTAHVVPGVIVSQRQIKIENNSGAGGVAGTAAGAVAGASIGGNATTAALGAIGGAVVGGVVGDALDNKLHQQMGTEFIIRTADNKLISIAQAPGIQFADGDHVLVIFGTTTRVIRDERIESSAKK